MVTIYEMIEQRASDLSMLATQTDIDYDADENLVLEEKNYEHIVEDMRGRWNKVSELASEIQTLIGTLGDLEHWRSLYKSTQMLPGTYAYDLSRANEEMRRQQNRIEDR